MTTRVAVTCMPPADDYHDATVAVLRTRPGGLLPHRHAKHKRWNPRSPSKCMGRHAPVVVDWAQGDAVVEMGPESAPADSSVPTGAPRPTYSSY